tara:strand:+ start:23898 stop:24341 length:444 start_codon:yes stop_codon:yes gene_type:complete
MNFIKGLLRPSQVASAHCDGPCGVYDPASARIAAEAVLSMAKKLVALEGNDLATENTRSRYIAIKEEQAQVAKTELLILWTDYFKPPHLEANPEIHNIFWNAAKLCSQNKVDVSVDAAQALVDTCEQVHNIFWASKSRDDVSFYTAG